jgi:L-threonylcarbamoyladenylate synthase
MLWRRLTAPYQGKGGVQNWTDAFFMPWDSHGAIKRAADIIKNGGIGAFPTETVYGLGADAFNPDAVARVYGVKGRPADNPLILHVNTIKQAESLTLPLPEAAKKLMEAFWPGPLTLVLKKDPSLPAWVGGHPGASMTTAAIRAAAHEAVRALIEESGCVIAAPSANKAGTPSPTRAAHVTADFSPEDIGFILDGGNVSVGIESTVVDMTGDVPCILRPGAVTDAMIREITGAVAYAESVNGIPRSPGQKYRHYAPKAPMTLVISSPEQAAGVIIKKIKPGIKTGILATEQTQALYREPPSAVVLNMGDREDLPAVARNLYSCLRRFDELGVEEIFAESVPETGLGRAIMNRLRKASEKRMVYE